MATDNFFVVKNGLQSEKIDLISPNKANTISIRMLDSDTLSFSGDSGQLFSITDTQSGAIFSVNDISGAPSIEVDYNGTIRFAETFGNVLIGTNTDDGTNKLQINGGIKASTITSTGDLVVGGNLTVNGTTTTVNTETINLADNIIVLNSNETGTPSQNAGIEIERGTSTNVSLLWNETTDRWTSSNPFEPAGGLFVDGTQVISSNGSWVGPNSGLIGYTGSQGAQGTTGFTGSQGDQGTTGFVGSKGDLGYTGSQGIQGDAGTYGWSTKTANYTAQNLDAILANTSGGSFTITLPLNPSIGDVVVIGDDDDFSTNELIVDGNGNLIEGFDTFTINIQHVKTEFIYNGVSWQVFATISSAVSAVVTGADALGTITGDATFDLSTGNVFEYSPAVTSATIAFSNPPASGTPAKFDLTIEGYTQVTNAWLLSSATLVNSYAINLDSVYFPEGMFFRADGYRLYIADTNTRKVYEYHLSTAWDISTAELVRDLSIVVNFNPTSPRGLVMSPDGVNMYFTFSGVMYQFQLSSPWDISTASDFRAYNLASKDSAAQGIFFKDDGLAVYMVGINSDSVHQYTLSTAWDISTASFVRSFSVSAQDTNPRDVFFRPDGSVMYVLGGTGDDVNQYNLSTPWDISTAVYSTNRSVNTWESNPLCFFFRPIGNRLYVAGSGNSTLRELNLGVSTDASITYDHSVQWLNDAPDAVVPDGTTLSLSFVTTDGGATYQAIYENAPAPTVSAIGDGQTWAENSNYFRGGTYQNTTGRTIVISVGVYTEYPGSFPPPFPEAVSIRVGPTSSPSPSIGASGINALDGSGNPTSLAFDLQLNSQLVAIVPDGHYWRIEGGLYSTVNTTVRELV